MHALSYAVESVLLLWTLCYRNTQHSALSLGLMLCPVCLTLIQQPILADRLLNLPTVRSKAEQLGITLPITAPAAHLAEGKQASPLPAPKYSAGGLCFFGVMYWTVCLDQLLRVQISLMWC